MVASSERTTKFDDEPSSSLSAGPADTAFYLSGTSVEGDAAFPTIAQPAGINFISSVFGVAGGALNLSAGSYLATTPAAGSALATALPSGSSESASASVWVKCPASALSSSGLVSSVVSWGAPGSIALASTAQQQLGLAVQEGAAGAPTSAAQNVWVSTYSLTGSSVPQGVAVMGASIIFSTQYPQNQVRLLSPSGTFSTLASGFNQPEGVAVDPTTGNILVADSNNYCIKSIAPGGTVAIFAGSGGYSLSDGAGTTATFGRPSGVAVSSSGLIAVSDGNFNLIRLITNGVTTTLAGGGGGGGITAGCQDGTGTGAYFSNPYAVTFDGRGNIIVADSGCGRIRKVSPQGVTTTFAGWSTGFADGRGTSASFWSTQGLAIDAQGNVIVVDTNNQRIRKVSPLGDVTTLAGFGVIANGPPIDGAGSSATFSYPHSLAVDSSGRIFVSGFTDKCIRLLTVIIFPSFANACDSTWHCLAITSNASSNTLSAYIDGALSLQTQLSLALPTPGSSMLSIGWSGSLTDGASGSNFTGTLSELRIYNRPLAPSEVLALSQPPLPSFPLTTVSPPAPTIGATSYAWLCLPGYFDTNANATVTAYCPSALVQSPLDRSWSWSASLAPNCQLCAQGFFALAGAASCTPCAAGFSSSVGASSCYASSAVVGEQTCSAASHAIPPASGLLLLPAAANRQGVDLVVATNVTCAARAALGAALTAQCNMSAYFLASDNVTELFVVGTAASMNMRAAEQLLCSDTDLETASPVPSSALPLSRPLPRACVAGSVTVVAGTGFSIHVAAAPPADIVFQYYIVQY